MLSLSARLLLLALQCALRPCEVEQAQQQALQQALEQLQLCGDREQELVSAPQELLLLQ